MILIFPWCANTNEGKPSPKNYPYWGEVVKGLETAGFKSHQVSRPKEPVIPGVHQCTVDAKLSDIETLMRGCDTWLSSDSFAQHMAWTLGEPGVVIFGPSDPIIFGHPENINLLRDRRFLREQQFWLWSQTKAYPEMFVGPEAVVSAAILSIENRKKRLKAWIPRDRMQA